MSDYSLLKVVAEAAEAERLENGHRWPEAYECDWFDTSSGPEYEYLCSVSPATVLELIAENESLRLDAARFAYIEQDADSGMSRIYGDDWIAVIDAAISSPENP